MEDNNSNKKKLTRKDFLRISGSIVAGGAIAGVSGKLISDMVRRPDKLFFDAEGETYDISDGDVTVSPYRRTTSLRTPAEIEAFDICGDRMIAASGGAVTFYTLDGKELDSFKTGTEVRDICVDKEEIYVLYPARIEVFSQAGEMLRGWDACSDNSDYCSLTVTPTGVFVTDVFAKNICKYTRDGGLVKFIDSPNGFVIPSYCFAIASHNGTIYCSNAGRHIIESYTEDGKYITSFGQAGTATGSFCGCCNPVHLYISSAGEIITSEKGIPRVSCYSTDGRFRSVLLNRRALGGGYDAYEARLSSDGQILAAGKHSLSVYKYDASLAAENGSPACEICGITSCPIRRGITV
ncbi:MAG: hypothetical protein J6Y83_07930 [Bacteroidales bacterium]|nr:hypothetical protein [Bacteroidales bacterium]